MLKNYGRIIEAVGLNLRIARQKAKLTQGELSKLSGVSRNQIAKIELGKVYATVTTLDMVCTALGVKVRKILEPYDDERYVNKNASRLRSQKALLRVSGSQEPQDTRDEKFFKASGLAGGDKGAKIKLRLIKLQIYLYYTKVVVKKWKILKF